MTEAFVKFFKQRLDSLLLCETESFSGLKHQAEGLMSTLRKIAESSGDIWRIKGDAAVSNWINELRGVIVDVDNLIDEFISQMNRQKGSDRSELTKHFTSQLQAIESRTARSVQQMTRLKNSTTVGDDNENNKDEERANPAATREEKDNKESSHEVNNSISTGEEVKENKNPQMEEDQTSHYKKITK